jgi:hypothetical protein
VWEAEESLFKMQEKKEKLVKNMKNKNKNAN